MKRGGREGEIHIDIERERERVEGRLPCPLTDGTLLLSEDDYYMTWHPKMEAETARKFRMRVLWGSGEESTVGGRQQNRK